MQVRLYESLRAVFYTPYYVALERGAHQRLGLEVVLDRPETSDRSASDLFEGKADITWGGPMRMMQHMNQDPDPERRLVAFGEAVTRDPFLLVGAEPNPEFQFSDLTKFRLATVSEVPTPWMCLQEDLRRSGIDPASIDRIANSGMAENAEALRRGDVDVIQVFEPFIETLMHAGAGHIWQAGATRGPTSYTTYYATVDYVRRNRETLKKMVQALQDAQTWLHVAEAPAIADMVHPYFPDLNVAILTGAIDRYRRLGVWGRNPRLPVVGFVRLKVSVLSGGFIDQDVPFDSCVDNSIADAVIAEQ